MASGIVDSGSYPARRVRSGSVIREQASVRSRLLPLPGSPRTMATTGPSPRTTPLGKVEDGGELVLSPHEAPRHRISSQRRGYLTP